MTFKHIDFIFDYTSYKADLLGLSYEIESGNTDNLSGLVKNTRETVGSPDKWILHNNGTSIGDIGFDKRAEYRNALLGHWLLIVLSKYLSPAKSLGFHWNRLFLLLRTLGWKEEDVHELIFGNSVAILLNSDYLISTKAILKWSDPYWMWIRPERSIYSGLAID